MNKSRFALIGVGNMGKNHARVLNELPAEVDLKYIVDVNELEGSAYAKKYRCEYRKDYRDIADAVDAVCIVVPTQYHYEVARYFMERGKHVLLEKPIAKTLLEADKLVTLARNKNVVLQIGHIERFNPTIKVIKNIVKDPYLIEIQRLNPLSGRISDVGVILDLQIHDIDLAYYLADAEVASVNAMVKTFGPHEDLSLTHIEFQNGCLANLATSRVTHNKIRKIGVSQKDCYISGNLMTFEVEVLKRYTLNFSENTEKFNYRSESTLDRIYVQKEEPLKAEIKSFVDAIKNNSQPLVTGEDGFKALRIAYQVLDAVH